MVTSACRNSRVVNQGESITPPFASSRNMEIQLLALRPMHADVDFDEMRSLVRHGR
jgi:hypothetical protein